MQPMPGLIDRLLAIEVSALCDADKTLPIADPAIRATGAATATSRGHRTPPLAPPRMCTSRPGQPDSHVAIVGNYH